MKRRAFRKLVHRTPPTLVEKFITLGSKQIYDDVHRKIKVVHGCFVQPSPEVFISSLLVHFGWVPFLYILEDVYEEAVRLFYYKFCCLAISEGEEPILKSHSLNVELSVSSYCDMLNLPKESDSVFFSSLDKLLSCQKLTPRCLTKF